MLKTKIHVVTRATVSMQPTIAKERFCPRATETAKVAVVSAVFGNTNEYQFMAKCMRPCAIQEKWAPTDTKKNHTARLE